MPHAVKYTLLLYADDSCILYQHNEVDETEKYLNKDFENIYDWFVDNKLSIYTFLLTAIWLPHGQLWAIIEATASLTRC